MKHIKLNSPVVLSFCGICLISYVLNLLTGGAANRFVFSVYRSSLLNPLTYIRCVCHVFSHAGWGHLINNMMYVLLLGPMIEEKYGSAAIAEMMAVVAVVTGIFNMIFFPATMLLGASGIVFALIIMSSITNVSDGAIPLTLILVAVLFIGQQVYEGLFSADNISQITHIIGGAIGGASGILLTKAAGR